MHGFWEMIGFVANTVLFFVTGQIIAYKVLEADTLRWIDFAYLFVIYIFIHITRFATVCCTL